MRSGWLQKTLTVSALAAACCASAARAQDAPAKAIDAAPSGVAKSFPALRAVHGLAADDAPFLVAQSAANAAPVATEAPSPAPAASGPAPTRTASIEIGDKDPGKPAGDGTGEFDVAPKAPPATAELVARGKEVFNGTCNHCHGPDAVLGVKKIDLRRLALRYGDGAHNMYWKTVHEGRQTKGMPAWKDVFTDEQLTQIYVFLSSIQTKE